MNKLVLCSWFLAFACAVAGCDRKRTGSTRTRSETRRGVGSPRPMLAPEPMREVPSRPPVSPQTPPGGFRFAWPVGNKVWVTEKVTKQQRQTITATMTYVLQVQRMPGGSKDLKVSWHGIDFVKVGGQPVTQAMRAQMGGAFRLARLIPPHRIGPKGKLKELIEFDRLYEAAFSDMPTRPGSRVSPEQTRLWLKRMKPIVKQQARIIWTGWVESWIGVTLKPGQSRRLEPTLGRPAIQIMHHHGGVAGFPGHVELSLESRMTGESAKSAVAPLLGQLGAAMPPDGKNMLSSLKSMSVVQRMRVVTRPTTLMPASASRDKILTIDFGGGRVLMGGERHEYTFRFSSN